MGVQNHPRSLILMPNESACATSYQLWSCIAPFRRYGDLYAENCHFVYTVSFNVLARGKLFEFLDDLTLQKLQNPGSIRQWRPLDPWVFLTQYQRVTDGRTDSQINVSIIAITVLSLTRCVDALENALLQDYRIMKLTKSSKVNWSLSAISRRSLVTLPCRGCCSNVKMRSSRSVSASLTLMMSCVSTSELPYTTLSVCTDIDGTWNKGDSSRDVPIEVFKYSVEYPLPNTPVSK